MPRQNPAPIADDHGWLITPRALTSVATVVGLVYTLHAPIRYVLHVGETVDALSSRVATLETEIDQQRGTIAAVQLILAREQRADRGAGAPDIAAAPPPAASAPRRTAARHQQ